MKNFNFASSLKINRFEPKTCIRFMDCHSERIIDKNCDFQDSKVDNYKKKMRQTGSC